MTYNNTELAFAEELRKGNKKAFTKLVEDNSDALYKLVYRMLNNESDAEDILQETFIKAYRYLPDFKGNSKISTWLYRIAINETLMLIRKRKPEPESIDTEIILDDGESLPKTIVDWCCLPEKELMKEESRNKISDAIDKLSPANKVVFVMRDLSGLSTSETAEALQISESAVKTRLLRARLNLRESLTDYFAERMETE